MSKLASGMWSIWRDTSTEMAIETSLVAAFAVLWFTWIFNKSSKAIATLPPGPRGFPVVGYLPFLGTELHKTFTELATVYGPIYKLWLGNKLCVVVSSPSLVKEVVRDQDTIFANRDPPISGLVASFGGNDIAWCPYGPDWRKMRKIFVGNMMSNTSLDACYSLRKKQVKNTIRDVYNYKIGKPLDIGELSISTLIYVLQSMMWGGALELGEKGTNLGAELKSMFSELVVLFGTPNISDLFPVLSWIDIQGIERRTKRISLWFEKTINSALEQHKNKDSRNGAAVNNEENKDFLQILLERLDNKDRDSSSISMIQLKGILTDILIGGTDTSTTMVEWTMTELMQYPKVMKKVQEELTEVVGMDRSAEESDLPKLKYLEAVVKETFRLHPALPLLVPRKASQSSSIGGYTIPKDTRLMLNVWAIHRDPELWDNPLEFHPDRFLKDNGRFDYLGNNFQYLPFGSGRRMCAGIALAERMLMFVLASLLHSFEWKLPAGTKLDLSEKFGIVIKKKEPLIVIPTPRLSNYELYQ